MLAVATSLVLLLLFLGTNWTTIFLGIEESSGINVVDALLGFKSLNGIVDTMIGLVAVVLVFFSIGAIAAARRVAKVPTIRLASTKQPPELSIGTGLTWHLFLSHIWCVAQLGVIKPGRIQLHPPNHAGRPVKTPSESSRVSSSCWCRASRSFSTRARAQPRRFSYTQPF